jgi:hypothetical protein
VNRLSQPTSGPLIKKSGRLENLPYDGQIASAP